MVLRERVWIFASTPNHTRDEELRRKLLTFVVVGGGYTGIELITELHDLLFGYVVKRYRGIRADEIRLIVVEAGADILRGIHPKLAESTRVTVLRERN